MEYKNISFSFLNEGKKSMTLSTDYWMKRTKWLTQALIISGTLNVGLFSTFLYLVLRDQHRILNLELQPTISHKSTPHMGIQELLVHYQSLSFQELLDKLTSCEHVESGYTRRDLALAALVAFHQFNLERALGGLNLQRRLVSFRDPTRLETMELTIFPALTDYQYQAIIQYAKTERWPLTSKGLFLALKKSKAPYDPSLIEAFSLTPQFHFICTLFAKTGAPLHKEQIVSLLSSGSWEIIQEMSELLRTTSAFDPQRRRQLLIRLMAERSQLATALLLQTDTSFIFKRFDDNQMLAFLDLLGTKTPPLFAKALLVSPRSDAVWKRAASLLYSQAGEILPEPYDHRVALSKFLYGNIPPQASEQKPLELSNHSNIGQPRELSRGPNVHRVQEGETLWKIARAHKVSIETLRALNSLHEDRLRPGQELRVCR